MAELTFGGSVRDLNTSRDIGKVSSTESKFKRCKSGVKGTKSKKFAVCSKLNPANKKSGRK